MLDGAVYSGRLVFCQVNVSVNVLNPCSEYHYSARIVCVCVCLCGRVYVCGASLSCSGDTVASSRVAFLSTMQVRNAVCVCVLDLVSAPTGYVALSALSSAYLSVHPCHIVGSDPIYVSEESRNIKEVCECVRVCRCVLACACW